MTETAAAGDLLAAALDLATAGLPVFPLHAVRAGVCTCGELDCPSPGKHPRLAGGFTRASEDVAVVAAWWQRWPDANIGLRTGAESGLVVLDVDVQHGGGGTLRQLEQARGSLPHTAEVLTGGGGRHLLFRHPGREVRNSAGKLGHGLDVRGDGGYIVAPPSLHASGRPYKWVRTLDRGLADPPPWLLDDVDERRNGSAPAVADLIEAGRRNETLASLAGTMRRRGMAEPEIRAALLETNRLRCSPPLDADEVGRIAASIGRYPSAGASGEPTFATTDLGNAEMFARRYADRVRHVRERRQWLHWDGTRWQRDATGEAERAAKEVARSRLAGAAELDGDEQTREARWALVSQAEPRLRAMLALAATEPEIALTAGALDRDPFLLACANGTLDLRTGELRPHDPADLITLGTRIAYDATAACPRWERFLLEVFDGDEDLVSFMQRATGYCLTGDTSEQCFLVLHGSGWNGKTVLTETVKRLAGDHAATASFESFVRSRSDRGVRNDLARLHGARLVAAAESGEGRHLDEATVKTLTGGDTVVARFLYGEHFEFRPEFKLWLITNHRPRVDGDDDAIWRRIRLVPFEVSFEGRADPHLPATLEAELPGILRWAVDGCLAWQRDGLGNPPAVQRATRDYRADEDVLGAFLADRCTTGGEVEVGDLRSAYDAYCKEIGEKPLAASVLGRRLARHGISSHRSTGGSRIYRGVHLNDGAPQ